MNRDSFLLSIAIPTKDRYETLIPIIDYFSSFNQDLVEIVIQDNSINNSPVKKKLTNLSTHKNFKYYHSQENLSVVENFDQAILHCSGEFICSIGDDDGVMPYIDKVAQWMKRNNIQCVTGYKPHYYWPGQRPSYFSDKKQGILNFEKNNYKVDSINPQQELNKVLYKGGTEMGKLPSVYHGIIHRSLLAKLKNLSNSFFPGPSPDMASAVGLTRFKSNSVYINFPVFISGKQPKSTGGQGTIHKHIAPISEVKHLPKKTCENWEEKIPKYWTGETIYAQTIISALENTGKYNLISKLNYSYLYARILVFHFSNRDKVFKGFSFFEITSFKFCLYLLYIFIKRAAGFIKARISTSIETHEDINNITIAVDCIMKNIKTKKIESILNE